MKEYLKVLYEQIPATFHKSTNKLNECNSCRELVHDCIPVTLCIGLFVTLLTGLLSVIERQTFWPRP